MKKIKINTQIFKDNKELHIGVVIAQNINNKNIDTKDLIKNAKNTFLNKYHGLKILDLPEIDNWRKNYKSFGAKKGYRSSIETLTKRVLKSGELPSINPLVDIYNCTSLNYLFPCGGEDLNKIFGNLLLEFASGEEEFYSIGSEKNDPPKIGEIVYKDDQGIICRCFNYREADRTKLTSETKNAILIIETLSHERIEELKCAIDFLKTNITTLLGGEVKSYILDEANNELFI